MGNRTSTIEESLRIQIGGPTIDEDNEKRNKQKIPTQQNRVKSTKYTPLTFLPKNLSEQFRRLANFYFLTMTTISLSIDSPVSPLASLIPLIIVISVAMFKQGYEDFLRYRADSMVNKSMVKVIRNGVEVEIKCEDIIPGDLVRVARDCDIPCDLLLMKSSDKGKCFITTANLDGETNLKTLVVPKGLPELDISKLYTLGYIECEPSHTNLYSFNGRIELSNATIQNAGTSKDVQLQQNIPLMAENLLLRGSRVKNTEWVIACAVYTGAKTKLALNSKITRAKMSSTERFVNTYIGIFLIILLTIVFTCFIMKRYYDRYRNSFIEEKFDGNQPDTGVFQDFFSFLLLFYYFIPLALYIAVEIHKLIGSFFLEWDLHLYDEETNQPCIVNTSDLNEELGQVNILFSDKTGTLTKNVMVFKQCSINGKMFFHTNRGLREVNQRISQKIGNHSKSVYTFFEALSICHTIEAAGSYETFINAEPEIPVIFHKPIEDLKSLEIAPASGENSQETVEEPTTEMETFVKNRSHSIVSFGSVKFHDDNSAATSKSNGFRRASSARSSKREFYAAPQYTEEQVAERKDSVRYRKDLDRSIDLLNYQASSPDEKALVEACARLGIVYLHDHNDIYTLKLGDTAHPNSEEDSKYDNNDFVQFKRLQVLEFTSERKRMSVIVMDKNGQIWLYTKGAESHVLPLCKSQKADISERTQNHINDFAKLGLRTLAIARKKLSYEDFVNFQKELNEANCSLTNRVEKVEACHQKIESDQELLGATAVEDALQDDVRDTLIAIREAGIKVWVLSGDKVETALNISLSCGHIPEDGKRFIIVDCLNERQVDEQLDLLNKDLLENPESQYALLIDGSSLAIALKHSPNKFRDLAYQCHAVLCCRLSPLQKCEVVHLVKTCSSRPITAAIGDGANDVSMIQEAHVGIGIVGKEGRQAARCADFAFGKFSMLKRIFLVHGYYYSQRIAFLILYFFYKNVVFMACQLYFQSTSSWSTFNLFDSLFLTLYNITYTTLACIFLSLTEKVHEEEKLMSNPALYQDVTGNKLFAFRHFNTWMLLGLYHSVIIYGFSWYIWTENAAIFSDGSTVNYHCFFVFIAYNVCILVLLKLVIEANYKTYMFMATIWLSMIAFIGITYMHNLFFAQDDRIYMVFSRLLASTFFWVSTTLIQITGLLPDFLIITLGALNIKFRTIFPGNEKMRTKKYGPTLTREESFP